jgi:Zn-dependent protease
MVPSQSGSFRLFRVAGIDVFLHWSWFLAAWYILSTRNHVYSSWTWNAAEYVGLFLMVLIHEFGHVLACRQVGGVSSEIVLWPLGGVALARPPARPGAELWTIAAGPLVNVVLWPVLMVAAWACSASGLAARVPDLQRLIVMLWWINQWLLIFNVLPIYPLDGGQILRSLLWFQIGRARSLHLACSIGLIGITVFGVYRLVDRPDAWLWTVMLALFLGSQCLAGFKQARALVALEGLPRHTGFKCPSCQQAPPGGPIWLCPNCTQRFDPFSTDAACPHCQAMLASIACLHCGAESAFDRWRTGARQTREGQPPYVDI